MGKSPRDLDFLLAGGRLPGPEKERILERVLATAAPRPWWRRPWVSLGMAGTLAAAAAIVLVPRLASRAPSGLVARGSAVGQPFSLDLACSDGPLSGCPQGATLIFAVRGQPPGGFLTAYAEPVGGGERVWYFSADGEAPRVDATAGTQPLARGVRVGSEHTPGDYRVHVLLSRAPLTRAAVAGAAELLGRQSFTLTVVPR